MFADLETLAQLAERAQAECMELKASFLRLDSTSHDACPALPEGQIVHISSLIGPVLKNLREGFGFMQRLLRAIKDVRDADLASFTTIEISISVKATAGTPVFNVSGQVNYSVPNRLPCRDTASFLPEGSTSLVRLHVPVFYAGRLTLLVFDSTAANSQAVEATIVKVDLYNGKNQCRALDPVSFYKDRKGRFVSPVVYLL